MMECFCLLLFGDPKKFIKSFLSQSDTHTIRTQSPYHEVKNSHCLGYWFFCFVNNRRATVESRPRVNVNAGVMLQYSTPNGTQDPLVKAWINGSQNPLKWRFDCKQRLNELAKLNAKYTHDLACRECPRKNSLKHPAYNSTFLCTISGKSRHR